jgi:hypothetical protein
LSNFYLSLILIKKGLNLKECIILTASTLITLYTFNYFILLVTVRLYEKMKNDFFTLQITLSKIRIMKVYINRISNKNLPNVNRVKIAKNYLMFIFTYILLKNTIINGIINIVCILL